MLKVRVHKHLAQVEYKHVVGNMGLSFSNLHFLFTFIFMSDLDNLLWEWGMWVYLGI